MNCTEARQYIFAFLDNELDRALSLEVQQHIEHCPLCARECEIENVVRKHLVDKLQQADDLPAFDEPTLARLIRSKRATDTASILKRSRYLNWVAVSGIAAAVLFAVTLLFVQDRTKRAEPASLADALVDDFDHFVTKGKPLQIESADATEVSAWLRDRTALAVNVPNVDRGVASLRGGRKCEINGSIAAFAVYAIGDELASLVVLKISGDALSRMERVERGGHTHWVDRCRGHTVLACRRGELVYAVVSRLSEEALSELMPPTEG